MYSLVIKIATVVRKAVEEVNTVPKLGFINDTVDVEIAHSDPNNILVVIDNIFFSFKILYFIYFFL